MARIILDETPEKFRSYPQTRYNFLYSKILSVCEKYVPFVLSVSVYSSEKQMSS